MLHERKTNECLDYLESENSFNNNTKLYKYSDPSKKYLDTVGLLEDLMMQS